MDEMKNLSLEYVYYATLCDFKIDFSNKTIFFSLKKIISDEIVFFNLIISDFYKFQFFQDNISRDYEADLSYFPVIVLVEFESSKDEKLGYQFRFELNGSNVLLVSSFEYVISEFKRIPYQNEEFIERY